MTRTAYAQLLGQKFFPPKIFGHWSEPEGTKEWRWRDVGMKIVSCYRYEHINRLSFTLTLKAVGFEMLYHESKGRTNTPFVSKEAANSSTEAKKNALQRNPEYIKYIQNLRSADYFRGEIEGSELWRSLEGKAANMFVEVRKEDGADRPSFASQVKAALSDTSKTTLIPQNEEDPDNWLNIDSEDFEAMLEQSKGNRSNVHPDAMDVDASEGKEAAEERMASAQATKLKEFAAKVENFVEGEGDLEGARFEEYAFDTFSDEEFSDEATETDDSEDEETTPDLTARQAAMDKLVPGIDPSDYGKMPASFHSNSQRVAPTNDMDAMDETVDETGASSTQDAPAKPLRQPIIPRDTYDGVDSDDETDEEDAIEDDESDEDRPQVLGEMEIDMAEEEEEFLEFSRQALGISDDQWNEIVRDRQERGAFLPNSAKKPLPPKKATSSSPASGSLGTQTQGRTPAPGPRPNVNPNLDSFEAVMQAMDVELSQLRSSSKKAAKASAPLPADKGKAKATVEDEDEDIESAMDAELKAALEHEDGDDDEDEEPPDYNLIKNFLESFKSQTGLSGPVGNLAGMLQPEWQLPRDSSLTKFYTPLHQGSQTVVQKIFSLIHSRPVGLCNFLDAPELEAFLGNKDEVGGRWQVVYRNYATLFFVFVVDGAESELGILDLIQVFVESLDRAFENVCELDLVFHFDEVHHILAEIIQAGLVLETNVEEIDASVQQASKARKESFTSANPLSLGMGNGLGPRGNLKTPLGWLTGKLTGAGAR
ncbi:hypothetical protein C0991_008788 [Blastosporella zonata]|nr:hypothetical protein C0991_008788 [Blastosporella zonata]